LRRAALAALVTISLALSAASASGGVPTGRITVLAASSLTQAFTEIQARFERKHPDTDVVLSFSSSSTLVTQVQQGAPADVIATADQASMDRLVAGRDASSDVVFARNRLAIAVAPGNPEGIETLADTLHRDLTLVLCAPEAPCGKYALEAYANAHLPTPSVPTGANAKDTLAKVALGEADAAVVYVTDTKAARGDVEAIPIATADNVLASYPIATVDGADNATGAKAFSRFVSSKAGQRILRRFGFLAP
jgi:molybdate transport system substrate-binding protein